MQLLSINVRIGTTFVMHAVSPRDFSNCELRQLFFFLSRTHIRTLDFRPHANRTHMCVLPKIHFTPAHAHLWQKGHFEANLAHKSPKLGLFYPKTCEKRAKLRSHVAYMKNGRMHAHRTHTLKAFSHAHRTHANVRAHVRVRI